MLILLGAALYGGYHLGRLQASDAVAELTRTAIESEAALERERQASADLAQRLALLERGSEMDQAAVEEARSRLKELQSHKLALEKELSLLRGLVSTTGGGILTIHDLKLQQGEEIGSYRYAFTISQLAQEFELSEGEVEISLTGKRDNKPATLSLGDLTKPPVKRLPMRFRHFQVFEGEIEVPVGFSADELVVEVKPKSNKLAPAVEHFAWSPGEPADR